MPPNRLTASGVASFTPSGKPAKHSDGGGLYMLVNPNGSRYWHFRFRFGGKQNTASCGVYPAVSLEQARVRRDELCALLAAGVNPSEHTKAERAELLSMQRAQNVPTRFYLDNDGALSVRLGSRRFQLTGAETVELRVFLAATSNLPCRAMP